MTFLEDNIENLDDFQCGNNFPQIATKIQSLLKKKKGKLDFIKTKNFCPVKDNIKRMTEKPQMGKKYQQKTYLRKDYHTEYIKTS